MSPKPSCFASAGRQQAACGTVNMAHPKSERCLATDMLSSQAKKEADKANAASKRSAVGGQKTNVKKQKSEMGASLCIFAPTFELGFVVVSDNAGRRGRPSVVEKHK